MHSLASRARPVIEYVHGQINFAVGATYIFPFVTRRRLQLLVNFLEALEAFSCL